MKEINCSEASYTIIEAEVKLYTEKQGSAVARVI